MASLFLPPDPRGEAGLRAPACPAIPEPTATAGHFMTVKIDGAKLKIRDVVRVARPGPAGRFEKAALHPAARDKMAATRAYIDRHWMHDDAPLMYAFNTGVGLFKDQRILVGDMADYQRKTVLAHATGVGEPFAEDTTRAMMLLRANAFASNYSGPRLELVERLVAFLNAGLHPVIPQKGSVGASGDLAPLAHMAGAVCGFEEAEIVYKGKRLPAREAIREGGLRARLRDGREGRLGPHQRLDGVACARRARRQRRAPAPEAGRHRALPVARGDARRARGLRSAPAQGASACRPGPRRPQRPARPRRHEALLAGGARYRLPRGKPRSPGSRRRRGCRTSIRLRCAPQVHGPAVEAIEYAERILGDRDQCRDRQPADLRRRRRRLRLDLGRPFPRPVHGAGDGLPRHRGRRPRRDLRAPPRAPHRPGDELRPAAQPARRASAASTPATPPCSARCRRS